MRLVLLTDNLGSGGAQRQLCLLAIGLQRRGHDVTVLTYNECGDEDGEFFVPLLESAGVARNRCRLLPRWRRPIELATVLDRIAPDAVLAFQGAASAYAELAGLGGRRWGLVVSERSALPGSEGGATRALRLLHGLSDEITTNSHTNRRLMSRSWRWLGSKVHVIYNGVDLNYFRPSDLPATSLVEHSNTIRLVVLASYQRLKNLTTVLEAMVLLHRKVPVHLRWHGGTREDKTLLPEALEFVRTHGLSAEVDLRTATKDARRAYWDSDAVLLASLHEGCPNVVCEAMACGKPVLASGVSDNSVLVDDGTSGLLFNPGSPKSIADAIKKFADMTMEQRSAMGTAGRRRAERLFDLESCCTEFERLLESARRKQREHRV